MPSISRIAVLALLASVSTKTMAQEVEHLGSITLSASNVPKKLSETGASVSILSGDDIRRNGEPSIAQQLLRLPGVSASRNGGLGTPSTLRLRGLGGAYVGVVFDGINITDPAHPTGTYDFGVLTSAGLGRVEVLRGSQSALYGSAAVGGVVNLSGWRPEGEGTQGELALEGGSNGFAAASAKLGFASDRSEVALSYERLLSDGISVAASGPEEDGFTSSALTFFGAYQVTEALRIGANGFARDVFTEFDRQFADSDDTEEGRTRGARLFATYSLGNVEHELSYARNTTHRLYRPGTSSATEGEREVLSYQGAWPEEGALSLTWGGEYQREAFADAGLADKVFSNALFGEALWAFDQTLDLSLALRRDHHAYFGGQTTGRAALAWRPSEDWVIRAVASTGFRAPSLYELYSDYGLTTLKPETSRNLELGAEYLMARGAIQATLFQTRIDDRILWDNSATSCRGAISSGWAGCYGQGAGETRTRGIELSGNYQINDQWSLWGNYTYVKADEDTDAGKAKLLRVPRHDLTIGLDGEITQRLSTSLSLQHVAGAVDAYAYYDAVSWSTKSTVMDKYTLINASLTYDISDQTAAYLRLENLTDERYQTVYNYNQPGRQIFIGLRQKF